MSPNAGQPGPFRWVKLNPDREWSPNRYPPPDARSGDVSGPHWIIPNGRSAAGDASTLPTALPPTPVPMNGFTSRLGDPVVASACASGRWPPGAPHAPTTSTINRPTPAHLAKIPVASLRIRVLRTSRAWTQVIIADRRRPRHSERAPPGARCQLAALVFTIAWYGRHGSLRRLVHGGSAVGTFTPGTTGSTRLDGIGAGERDRRRVPLGTVSSNDQIGCVPFGAAIVTRMRDPARYAWPS